MVDRWCRSRSLYNNKKKISFLRNCDQLNDNNSHDKVYINNNKVTIKKLYWATLNEHLGFRLKVQQ
jgi:hypothetical protein